MGTYENVTENHISDSLGILFLKLIGMQALIYVLMLLQIKQKIFIMF